MKIDTKWLACLLAALGMAPVQAQAPLETVLHNFKNPPRGATPGAGVIRDPAGNFYGTTYTGGAANAGVVFKLSAAGVQTVLYSFTGGADGGYPAAGVIRDSAGNLYGTTSAGGITTGRVCTGNTHVGCGVVFKLDPGGHETVLYSFTGGADGAQPDAGVIGDAAGNLYGTTYIGGASKCAVGCGVVYKVDPAGQETVLYTFTGRADGGLPDAGVVRDPAGNLYGTTYSGGKAGVGVVYKLDTTGLETVLYNFPPAPGGIGPNAGAVVRDSAGNLYGTTLFGGIGNCGGFGCGQVYKLDTSGQETVLYNFTGGADGAAPSPGGVVLDSAGNLYGGASEGGIVACGIGGLDGCGAVFKLDASGQETVLHSFTGAPDGYFPDSVILDSGGNLYGTTFYGGTPGLGTVYEVNAASLETVLYSFPGPADGNQPFGGVIRDSSGNLYGTTTHGGPVNAGTVYKLDAAGKETVLYSFTGGADGSSPVGSLLRDSSGNLYGTTSSGVVYKVDTAGHETVLYTFTGGADGSDPVGSLIRDSAGNLYGTTTYGGAANAGVVYKLDAAGLLTVLYTFTGGSDGGNPFAGVIADSSGNLYGTAAAGGEGWGVVYKLSPGGQETVLYTFAGGSDGRYPWSGVIRDSSGNLYGTASYGGTANQGVVYELNSAGQETVLHSFTGGSDGSSPQAGLVRDGSGNLYGTTVFGGPVYGGTVFEVAATGQETVLHAFTKGDDGAFPYAGVIRDSAGNLYGTTQLGGTANAGVVFKIAP